jgi:hypothetical protein
MLQEDGAPAVILTTCRGRLDALDVINPVYSEKAGQIFCRSITSIWRPFLQY